MSKIPTLLIMLLIAIQYSIQSPQEKEGKLGKGKENQALKKCTKLFDEDTKKEIEKGTCETDKTKKYLKCVYVGLFYMTCDGEINYGGLKAILVGQLKSKEKGEAIAEKCLKQSDSPENTACKIFMCFRENNLLTGKKKEDKKSAGSDD